MSSWLELLEGFSLWVKLLHFSRKLEMSKELPWVLFVARGSISSLGLGEFLEVDLFFLIMFILRL